ncbi:Copia protein, partial [Mucuna pruriens]
MSNGFQRGKVDTTLFHKNYNSHFIIIQIYLMQKEIEMSMMGELKLQEYVTLMHPTSILSLDKTDKKYNLGLWYKKFDHYRLKYYSDDDFTGDRIETKTTNRGCHFIRDNLVSWTSKRQGTIAISTAEAKYISTAQCCSQLLWIKHQLEDYDIFESNIPSLLDNIVVINLSKTPILHSHAKHIEIKHHFIRDITENQFVDIFTKPLLEDKLVHVRNLIEYFFDILVLADMGIDLTSESTSCWILPFFSHEQAVCPMLIQEFWINYKFNEAAFYGKVLGVEVRIDVPAIATAT